MIHSHEFFHRANEILTPQRVADLMGFKDYRSAYRLGRAPMDLDADGTGARSPADRMDALKDTLAAYPEGRALLTEWYERERAEHERRLGAVHRRRVTRETLPEWSARLARESIQALAAMNVQDLTVEARSTLARELADMVMVGQDLIHQLTEEEQCQQQDRRSPRMRAAG